MEVAMTCFWNGLRLRLIPVGRFWRRTHRTRLPTLDPRSLNAHWRRDLGFDN